VWAPSSAAEAGDRRWGPRGAFRSLVVVHEGGAQRYDAATSCWTDLPPLLRWRNGLAAASLGGRVFFAGGMMADGVASAEVTCFDPAAAGGAGASAVVAPMGTARNFAAGASLNGLLYVAGGYGDDDEEVDFYRSVERYSPASDTWEAAASMTSVRSDHQLVALGSFLYAIGGRNGGARMATAERYDPAANTWTPIASMASARSHFAAAAMGGFLYVTGGVEGPNGGPYVVLRRCERYDPAANAWSSIADLPEPRWLHALACLDGSLYAVGGNCDFVGPASTFPPWRFDATADAWAEVPLAAGSTIMSGVHANYDNYGGFAAL
jgi:kelch-like protein 17 (actinfilin)